MTALMTETILETTTVVTLEKITIEAEWTRVIDHLTEEEETEAFLILDQEVDRILLNRIGIQMKTLNFLFHQDTITSLKFK